ncbi:AMP-dependent synthetase/ligase [Actibacterium pelagium]|uniref:AMP-dependent synthetase n=1 Tax=Actibacterium pelagium TaxID=2029103 RepID=A0A917ANH2_9RHOB|nr:long-chain fatty acid--CoA ligase [Actibacterium pelagium]GGE61926.1 AMP-dependent synthetase [Actibacterium pelagium]
MIGQAKTIPEAFLERVKATPSAVAYRDAGSGGFQDYNWSDIAQRVARRRAAFAEAGLKPGDRVAIFLPNGIEWVVTDLAAMAQGLVTVPLYGRDSPANICHVMRDSGATLCLTDEFERWADLGTETHSLPDLRNVWLLSGEDGQDDTRVSAYTENNIAESSEPLPSDGDQLATIIYTSGTTGPPKGVMLSHGALLWNARAVGQVNQIFEDDVFLSILPLAHGFERSLGWLCPMLNGSTVAYGRSIEVLAEDLRSQRPTILLAVPRLFEKAHHKAVERAQSSLIGGFLMKQTERTGWRRFQTTLDPSLSSNLLDRFFWSLIGARVAARIRDAFGGRLRMVISGGAPLSAQTFRFMAAMEVPLIEGYGLTEAGPAATGSTFEDRRLESVGKALPGAEVRTGPKQELLIRSPGLMMGYWGNPSASAKAIDEDGWLHTGDAAEIENGWVRIKGRIKDILVLSTGENVNPMPIESAIQSDPLIQQACVLGDGKPWCSAVVVIDTERFEKWAENQIPGVKDFNDAHLRKSLRNRLLEKMDNIPPFARINAVHVEVEPWTLESGLLTPTLKAKRPKVAQRFRNELNALYD